MKKTGDEVSNKLDGLEIIQRNDHQNYTLDSRLLSEFCRINRHVKKILDIGTGNGILPMLLSKKSKAEIVGIEILEVSADLAKKNIKLNNLEERVTIINGDIKEWESYFRRDEFDQIITNPPFFKYDGNNSQINDLDQLTIARHEYNIKLSEIIEISSKLLKNNAYFTMVHRSERLVEILELLVKYGLEPKRLQFCHTKSEGQAKILLIEAIKNSKKGLKIEAPIIIEE
ncbi:MAG: tRNA1(Val) (adenine(37)-N6)-methyltransferase [Sebaldella sp.]|nr:tRNA1(Val) (adenine(37)-N6)-methyltransferase [Sebaldella sp.]